MIAVEVSDVVTACEPDRCLVIPGGAHIELMRDDGHALRVPRSKLLKNGGRRVCRTIISRQNLQVELIWAGL